MKRNTSPCGNADQPTGGSERLAYSIEELARLTSLGRTTIYKLISETKVLALTKVGRRSLVTAESWQRCLLAMKESAKGGNEDE